MISEVLVSVVESTMVLHPNANNWLPTIPNGPVAEALGGALAGCGGCRAVEVQHASSVAGYVVYFFEYTGLHWHHAYVAAAFRGKGLAKRAYQSMLDDARLNWTNGKPFELEAHGTSPEGISLLKALGFQHQGGVVYGRREQ